MADDHPVVREGVAALVGGQSDMQIVGQASNGREAIQQFRTHHPDITLMDIQMPVMSGLDALIAIHDEAPEARIVMLTTYAGDAQVCFFIGSKPSTRLSRIASIPRSTTALSVIHFNCRWGTSMRFRE